MATVRASGIRCSFDASHGGRKGAYSSGEGKFGSWFLQLCRSLALPTLSSKWRSAFKCLHMAVVDFHSMGKAEPALSSLGVAVH